MAVGESEYIHKWQGREAAWLAADGVASSAFYRSAREEASFGAEGRGQPLGLATLVPPDAPGYPGVISQESWAFVGATVVSLGILCALTLVLYESKAASSRTYQRLLVEASLALPSAALLGLGLVFVLVGLGYNI